MLLKRLTVVAFFLSAGPALAAVNEEFEDYLVGKSLLDDSAVELLWSRFNHEFGHQSPNAGADPAERMLNFRNNLQSVIEHNKAPTVTYKRGLNKFSDMTEQQFRDYYNIQSIADEQKCSATKKTGLRGGDTSKMEVPPSWDWRMYGGVSPVKNQGHCGSCWTFSTVGCLEAHALIRYGVTGNYSEQQLVDCAQAYDNSGCNGGLPSHAFQYISSVGGIATEEAYPYFATDHDCSVDPSTFSLTVEGGSVNITKGDEEELKFAIFEHGPVSVAFEVVDGFRDYASGVYSSDTCKNGTQDVNHAVLAVGYGVDEDIGAPYWIVKNSWGDDWGDKGFFKIHRGVNMCGIAMCNSYPAQVRKVAGKKEEVIEAQF